MNLKVLLARFSGFSLVGVANTLLSMALIWLLNECFHVHYLLSYVFAYVATVCLAYVVNAKCVFGSALSWRSAIQFQCAYLSGMIVGFVLLKLLAWGFSDVNMTLLSYLVIPVTMAWNFIFANRILADKGA